MNKIDKEFFEKMIGYELQDIKLEPIYKNGKITTINIALVPKKTLEFIDLDFKVLPSGSNFENFDNNN